VPQWLPVPVIVVGNLVVGGTGKTPLVIELVRRCARAAGRPAWWRAALAARAATHAMLVEGDSDAAVCGDEPLLIRYVTGAPVAVGPDRVAAARLLLARHAAVQSAHRRRRPAAPATGRATWSSRSSTPRGWATAGCCRPGRCAIRPSACRRSTPWCCTAGADGAHPLALLPHVHEHRGTTSLSPPVRSMALADLAREQQEQQAAPARDLRDRHARALLRPVARGRAALRLARPARPRSHRPSLIPADATTGS
jgi:hypothetical protein